jgi:signal transduction histidine kinase/CheY-like chemotaxis protein
MAARTGDRRDEAVLVLAPTGRDAALAQAVLGEHGIAVIVCSDLAALRGELDAGAGALILAEEAMPAASIAELATWLGKQPPWSDLPVLFLGVEQPQAAVDPRTLAAVAPLGNVIVVDRPVRIIALVTLLRAALRARRRQYELRDLLDRLARSVAERDRFLAMLGHELRNPLAVIVFGLEILRRAGFRDERALRRFEAIERQSALLTRLVDDLLDASRVTSGCLRLARAPVNLVELVRGCVDEAAAMGEAQGLDLAFVAAAGPVMVDGDPARLAQVVHNLLTNAAKYTPPGGRVRASVARDRARAQLVVEDSGVGISADMLAQIFEPFTQVESSLARSRGGLGLGLSVVHGLVELHGGTVRAESAGLGKGSRFTVSLPLLEPAAAAAPAAPRPEAARRTALRILVIEDNPDVRESLQLLLEGSGHHVEVAEDGPSGLAALLAGPPDVALVDIGLPGLDGYGVARGARSATGRRVFLVALSGYGQPEDKQRAREAGFDAHLTKPMDVKALEALLRKVAEGL